ncbi:MAG: RHS repeat-associated core domain-containing protein [Clostridia bacterium]|nr:RHS repeat-associated core domain-containing protein [Clostridia bacterium]
MNASWKDQLTAFNGNTITYDAIGNPLTYDGATYTWQGRRLTGYAKGSNVVSYQYNADGIRTAKVVNGFRTEYYLNGSQIIREVVYNSTGTYVAHDLRYFYDGEGNPCSIHYYTYDGAGNVTNDVIYLLTTNTQGDVTGIYSSNGNLLYTYLYDAWGNLIHESEHADGGEEAAAVNPFRYRGYYFDIETGYYYLNSRYYNPEWGRFLNADDANILTATPDALTDKNLYAYCDNNPVMRADDSGEFWHILVGAAVGVVTQYISDVAQNIASGETGSNVFKISSSWVDYAAAAVSGALAASGIGLGASIVANAAISGTAYSLNCSIDGEETDPVDFIIATGTGAFSGLIGGKGANGAKLRGIAKTSKNALKTAVSPKKIAMYTAKIADCGKKAVVGGIRTMGAGFFSNYVNTKRREWTGSAV